MVETTVAIPLRGFPADAEQAEQIELNLSLDEIQEARNACTKTTPRISRVMARSPLNTVNGTQHVDDTWIVEIVVVYDRGCYFTARRTTKSTLYGTGWYKTLSQIMEEQ